MYLTFSEVLILLGPGSFKYRINRFTKVLQNVHPKEYDQFIDLLKSKEYYSRIHYNKHKTE